MTIKYLIAALLSASLIHLWTPNIAKTPAPFIGHPTVVRSVETLAVPVEQPQPEVQTVQPVSTDDHVALMNLAGINSTDYAAADYIISHESSWRLTATEPNSGAYGLCQSLPASKMETAGADWLNNPVTQLKWCSSYATSRYGGWWQAYDHWVNYRWW